MTSKVSTAQQAVWRVGTVVVRFICKGFGSVGEIMPLGAKQGKKLMVNVNACYAELHLIKQAQCEATEYAATISALLLSLLCENCKWDV